MLIVCGPASTTLGHKVAETLGVRSVDVDSKLFPDGECYIRFMEDLKDDEAVIVQSTYPPSNIHLMQLFLMIDTALDLGVKSVSVVVPYLAYARQDKAFRPNEAVSIKTILHILEGLKVGKLVTVTAHEPEVFQNAGFPCINLSAIEVLSEYFMKAGIRQPMVFAPDKKARRMAEEASRLIGGDYGWFSKERDRITGEITMRRVDEHDVEGKDIILLDDIISTGGTTATAVKMLREAGAERVFSACVHALLIDDAYQRILNSGAEAVVATDTIPRDVSLVTVAQIIAKAIK